MAAAGSLGGRNRGILRLDGSLRHGGGGSIDTELGGMLLLGLGQRRRLGVIQLRLRHAKPGRGRLVVYRDGRFILVLRHLERDGVVLRLRGEGEEHRTDGQETGSKGGLHDRAQPRQNGELEANRET